MSVQYSRDVLLSMLQRSLIFKCLPYLIIFLLFSSGSLYPQSAKIDGAKNPELIPDGTASRLILLSLSLPVNPSATDIGKREYRLKRIGLTPFDLDTLRSLLNEFSSDYANWQLTVRSYSKSDAVASRDKLRDDFLLQMGDKLSQEGVTRFKQYVQSEKRKMYIPQ